MPFVCIIATINFIFTSVCGCGAGDAGCEDCGCCKVCAGDLDPHKMINHDKLRSDDIEYTYENGREYVKAHMEANEIKKVNRKKQKKDNKKKSKQACNSLTTCHSFCHLLHVCI